MSKTAVLAYSGGLDTTVAVKWLTETRGFDVIALTVDLGSQPKLAAIRQRALAAGASKAFVFDARTPFIERFCCRKCVLSAPDARSVANGSYAVQIQQQDNAGVGSGSRKLREHI